MVDAGCLLKSIVDIIPEKVELINKRKSPYRMNI